MAFLADLLDEWKKLNTPGKIAVGGALVGIGILAYANRRPSGVTGTGVSQGNALANGTSPFTTNVTATGTPSPTPAPKPILPPVINKIHPPLPFKAPPKFQGGNPSKPIINRIWPQPTHTVSTVNLHGIADVLAGSVSPHPIEVIHTVPGGLAWGSGNNRVMIS